jgi:hypothetical protein
VGWFCCARHWTAFARGKHLEKLVRKNEKNIFGFGVCTTVGSQLFRTIEMPESTSFLVFVVFCAKKSNGGSLFHKAVDANTVEVRIYKGSKLSKSWNL